MVSSTPLWTGREIAMPGTSMWIGVGVGGPVRTNVAGVVLDPTTSTTRPIRHGPVDDLRPQYLWTGAALLAFSSGTETSDANGHVYPGRAAAWNPSTNSWTTLPDAPLAGWQTVAAWTGNALLLWGELYTPRGAESVATTGIEFAP